MQTKNNLKKRLNIRKTKKNQRGGAKGKGNGKTNASGNNNNAAQSPSPKRPRLSLVEAALADTEPLLQEPLLHSDEINDDEYGYQANNENNYESSTNNNRPMTYEPMEPPQLKEKKIHPLRHYLLRRSNPPAHPLLDRLTESKFLSRGTFGCGFSPPLLCEEPCEVSECKDDIPRISKLMTEREANKEKSIYESLNIESLENWNQYFIAKPYMCSPKKPLPPHVLRECVLDPSKPLNPDLMKLLIFENGGPSLYKLVKSTNISLYKILVGLKNILEGVELLNLNGIFHFDIKFDNIVTGLKTPHNHFRLIDFGLSNKGKFFSNVNRTDIKYPDQLTQVMATPSPRGAQEAAAAMVPITPTRTTKATNLVTPAPKVRIEVNTPTIFRIFPIYQFFINEIFLSETESITDDEYELLSRKFVETFLTVDDLTVKEVLLFYSQPESGILLPNTDENMSENFTRLKRIMDKVYLTLFKEKTLGEREKHFQEMFKTLDIFSFGLLLYHLSRRRYITVPEVGDVLRVNTEIKNQIKIFLSNYCLLDPDPFKHIHNITQIKRGFNQMVYLIEGLTREIPAVFNPVTLDIKA